MTDVSNAELYIMPLLTPAQSGDPNALIGLEMKQDGHEPFRIRLTAQQALDLGHSLLQLAQEARDAQARLN